MMRAELKGAEEESTCGSDDVDISLSNPEYKGIIMLHVNKILLEKDNRTYKIIGTEIAGIFKKTKRNFIRRDGSKVIQVGEVDAIDSKCTCASATLLFCRNTKFIVDITETSSFRNSERSPERNK